MEWLNEMLDKKATLSDDTIIKFLVTISVMIPYFASELLENIFSLDLLKQSYPKYDPELARQQTIKLVVQVNGKTRSFVEIDPELEKSEVIDIAQKAVINYTHNSEIKKTIYVPGRLINFVI